MTGSGKTMLAVKLERELPAVRFSIDEWMIKLYGHHMSRKDFNQRMELVKQLIWELVEHLIALGVNVVLDYGFWRARERAKLLHLVESAGGYPVLYFLDIPLTILKLRLTKRNSHLPKGTFEVTPQMLDMFTTRFESPKPDEGIRIVRVDSTGCTTELTHE